jgi:hypothetical protein
MGCCVYLYIWTDQSVLSDGDPVAIQKNCIYIDERVISDKNMFPIITIKRGLYPYSFSYLAKKLMQ